LWRHSHKTSYVKECWDFIQDARINIDAW
jgi:hypothetical protein